MQSENAASACARHRAAGEQAAAVLRVRQVIAQRRIAAHPPCTCVRQILHQIRQAVGILGLIRIENLRLQVAALLGVRRRRSSSSADAADS